MLIESDRFIDGDLEAWQQAERMDSVYARLPDLARKESRALDYLRAFLLEDDSGYLGVSWGKDSVVAAHLLHRTGIRYPVVWVKIWPLFNPDCERVRDAFLSEHDVDYHEIEVEWTDEQVGVWREHARSGSMDSLGYSPKESAAVAGFKRAANRFGDRHVSGVRAEESGVRRLRMMRWGPNSPNTCAPIGYWSHQDVFSYLHKHNLPANPVYAMSMGGLLDRDRLRVDAFGGGKGSQRAEWEGRYYADRIHYICQQALAA